MPRKICPRCGRVFPDWQTIHLACLLDRLRWIWVPTLTISVAAILYFGSSAIYEWSISRPPKPVVQQATLKPKATQKGEVKNTQNSPSPQETLTNSIVSPTTNRPLLPSDTPRPVSTKTPTATIDPNLPPGMSFIPGATFMMGATDAELNWHLRFCNMFDRCNKVDYEDLIPSHRVWVDSYYIDIHEVTNLEYQKCVAAGDCRPSDPNAISKYLPTNYVDSPSYDQYPVVGISWDSASDYCASAGKRLPTEAEWERAAKGDDGRLFPWIVGIPGYNSESVFGQKKPFANYCDNSCPMDRWKDTRLSDNWEGPAPVMSFPAGPYGIYDMVGNVIEWTQDYYSLDYYSRSPDSNPINEQSSDNKVTRGGGWNNGLYHSTSEYRRAARADTPKAFIGFRCVQSLD